MSISDPPAHEKMPDLTIPENLPVYLQNQLNELVQDFTEENLTVKGYETKRQQVLDHYANSKSNPLTPIKSSTKGLSSAHARNHSWGSTVRTAYGSPLNGDNNSLSSNTYQLKKGELGSANGAANSPQQQTNQQNVVHRRHHSLYRVTTVNSNSDYSSHSTRRKRSSVQLSLPSNEIGGVPYNPMLPLLPRQEHAITTDSLPSILRGRFEHYPAETAFISINEKGKETSIAWDKLYLRAEKIAYILNREKLYKMDKVLLWYNRNEVIEFTVALLGCFIAGMVAIPVSFETYSLVEIIEIIKLTNSKHVLISSDCHYQLDNLHSTMNNTKMKLIKNEFFSQINFIKTDDLGSYSKAKKAAPTYDIPNVSYIEFTRTPLGRLSGVVMKHKVLSNQYKTLADILNSRVLPHWKKKDINRSAYERVATSRYTILNSLDPTRSTGLVLGVIFNIFSGNLLISIDHRLLQKAGGYENIIDRYRADILLNDQLQLKQVVINYLDDPQSTLTKKHKIDFSCIKCCLTSCTTIDTEVSDMIVSKWLKNLGCLDASICYSPILTLLDFGGVILSVRDQIGKLDNFQIHSSKLRLHEELFVNKEKLRSNIIEPSLSAMMNSSSFNEYLRVASFGFPIPDATVCVVNPDDNTLVPDLTVGEIWVHSDSLTNEFYQMDRVNDFVFKAKLSYQKMYNFLLEENSSSSAMERLNTIMNICPSSTQFLRTKLMGFIHNGKIFVLSMVEDMFLQNQLVRLPNWAHTSDVSKAKNSSVQGSSAVRISSKKRVAQTYYLQQITETLVRTVNTVFEVSAFELNHNKEEHFLIVVIESSLAKNQTMADSAVVTGVQNKKEIMEKKMNDLTEQVYRILWIFHRIQPMCVMVVPQGSLPRRYCSLELANSTVEKKFLSGELASVFVKFQVDNITLDFIPHSQYFNESIFSEHLSNLRRAAIKETINPQVSASQEKGWQASGIDYRETSIDFRTGKKLSEFSNILDILEWRIAHNGNDSAFSDGGESSGSSTENNIHKRVSWSSFDCIVASFLKKIVGSKNPLKRGDRVIIISENSVEYVAVMVACFYCNFVVIPYPTLREKYAEKDVGDFCNIVKNYGVKRIFTDQKTYGLFDSNVAVTKVLKKHKHMLPKITIFSKVKRKNGLSISTFKSHLREKYTSKPGTDSNRVPCVVWIDREQDIKRNIHITMTHAAFMNSCKILKETLQLSPDRPLFSLCSYTTGIGFMMSCLLGIYVGCTTSLFCIGEVTLDPKAFLIGLQNLNVKDLFLKPETFYMLIEKANNLVAVSKKTHGASVSKKGNSTLLKPDLFRNVQNFMLPFSGRPNTQKIASLIRKNSQIILSPTQINYVYQNHFNPHITLRSYLGIPPVDLYLDPVSLREGLVKVVDPSLADSGEYLRVQDSGIVPVCTDVSIVNPETNMPCYDGEFGEIWCCSEGNAFNYSVCKDITDKSSKKPLTKDPFITEQFTSKLKTEVDNGLTYLRTGDLGFIKSMSCPDAYGNLVDLNLLFVLGAINETVEILGLTHFVKDLERTVISSHPSFECCLLAKAGGLLVCLVKCREDKRSNLANYTALIVSELLKNHGVLLDLCAFAKFGSRANFPQNWNNNRATVMRDWFDQKLPIESQFGINFGENVSIYLLSEFEKGS